MNKLAERNLHEHVNEFDSTEKVDAIGENKPCMMPFEHWLKQTSPGSVMSNELYEWVRDAYEAANTPVEQNDYMHVKNISELYNSVENKLFALVKRVKGSEFDTHNDSCSDAIRALEQYIFGCTTGDGEVAALCQHQGENL